MTAVLQVENLCKSYARQTALRNVSFGASAGEIVGLIGPNGSGKTTTMRILLGLARATSGSATILGRRYCALDSPGRQVGVLLDSVGAHPRHTARQHLHLHALAIGVDPATVAPLLEQVGLAERADTRVKTYSLGMRRRLGLATALLGGPKVLVLDEPANGLDPVGSHWLRQVLREFAAAGGSVLISSHVLTELERTVDAVVLLNEGKVLATGAKDELLRSGSLDDFYLAAFTGRSAGSKTEG